MTKLSINIDHVATLRQARGTRYPEVVHAAGLCEIAGADGITVHLREDRRHIQDRDVYLLRKTLTTKLNLEMASTKEMQEIALDVMPEMVTLVPEKRKELTTEGGLNVKDNLNYLTEYIKPFKDKGILVSLFIDPDEEQVDTSSFAETDFVEIHTGAFCDAENDNVAHIEYNKILTAVDKARVHNLRINAGHGINYTNIIPLLKIPDIEEFSIGHGLIAHALFVGLENAVREMKSLFLKASTL